MHRIIILSGAAIGIMAAASADARTRHSGFRQTIEERFAAHDKKMCRWDPPAGGGPACRIVKMKGKHFTRASVSDRLNGWLGEEKISFDAAFYNGQLWSDQYDALVIFEKTRAGWQLRYSSMGNGQTDLTAAAGGSLP